MNNMVTLWGEAFRRLYPNVKVQVEGKGSSTAPPALIEGTAQVGPMSRKMKKEEIDKFEAKYGYPPTGVRVALDGIAVYVNKDNPLKELTLEQVDAIFSKSRKLGYKQDVTTWGQLGATGEWANKPISLYGRNSASGTYGYFKEVALGKGDYKDTVKEQPGSASVVQGVSEDKFGDRILGHRLHDVGRQGGEARQEGWGAGLRGAVRERPVGQVSARPGISTSTSQSIRSKAGTGRSRPLSREFLRYALSKEGQQDVVKDGYFPLPANVIAEERRKVG